MTPFHVEDQADGRREFVPNAPPWTYSGPGWYQAEKAGPYAAELDYYLLERRLLLALEARGKVAVPPPSLPAQALLGWYGRVRGLGTIAADSPGYDQFTPRGRPTSGILYELRTDKDQARLFFAIRTGEVSNDHHAYYELLFDAAPPASAKLRSARRFFFDVAGMEHAEFAGFATLSFVLLLPLWFVCWIWLVFRARSVRLAIRRGLCPRCRYDLRGNFRAGCPECGAGREPHLPMHRAALRRQARVEASRADPGVV